MIQRSIHVLAVQNLRESAKYYQNVLGFCVQEIGDDGWRMFKRDTCQIMAGDCPDSITAAKTGDHSYFAYLVLDNADDHYCETVANKADIIKPLCDEPWGMREFAVRTIDGHRIMFGQEITQVAVQE